MAPRTRSAAPHRLDPVSSLPDDVLLHVLSIAVDGPTGTRRELNDDLFELRRRSAPYRLVSRRSAALIRRLDADTSIIRVNAIFGRSRRREKTSTTSRRLGLLVEDETAATELLREHTSIDQLDLRLSDDNELTGHMVQALAGLTNLRAFALASRTRVAASHLRLMLASWPELERLYIAAPVINESAAPPSDGPQRSSRVRRLIYDPPNGIFSLLDDDDEQDEDEDEVELSPAAALVDAATHIAVDGVRILRIFERLIMMEDLGPIRGLAQHAVDVYVRFHLHIRDAFRTTPNLLVETFPACRRLGTQVAGTQLGDLLYAVALSPIEHLVVDTGWNGVAHLPVLAQCAAEWPAVKMPSLKTLVLRDEPTPSFWRPWTKVWSSRDEQRIVASFAAKGIDCSFYPPRVR